MTGRVTRGRPRVRTQRVGDGVHRIRLGFVSAYVVESDSGLVLIDTGESRHAARIGEDIRALGHGLGEVTHILVTHHHPDHRGSLAALAADTGARVHVHPADAPFVRGERVWTGFDTSAGIGRLLAPLLARVQPDQPEPASIDEPLVDGARLDLAGGITVLHTPGHTPGHTCFLLHRDGGVLVAGDAATNVGGLRSGGHRLARITTDDTHAAHASFARLAGLDFEVAVFGHGAPIRGGASERFRRVAAR